MTYQIMIHAAWAAWFQSLDWRQRCNNLAINYVTDYMELSGCTVTLLH